MTTQQLIEQLALNVVKEILGKDMYSEPDVLSETAQIHFDVVFNFIEATVKTYQDEFDKKR